VVEEHFHTRQISHDNSNQRIRRGMKNARLRKQSRKSAEIKSVRRIGNRGVVDVTNPSASPIQWTADGSSEIFSNKDLRRYKLLNQRAYLGAQHKPKRPSPRCAALLFQLES